MKKLIAIGLVLFCGAYGVKAQDGDFSPKGSHQVQVGYGPLSYSGIVLNWVKNKLDYKDVSQVVVDGPIHLRYAYQFSERWSVGASLNYAKYSAIFKDIQVSPNNEAVEVDIELSMRSFSALARIQFFPVVQKKWDMYLGASFGARFNTYSVSASVPWANAGVPGAFPLGAEVVLGLRYYPIENFGLYTEIGAAKSPIQLGLVYRFLKN